MIVLAVDTSSFPASVAISNGEVILGEYVIRNQRKHSQNIMVMIERLMTDLSIDISMIDVFAVTTGPGSFTGLRIGISSIRALAQVMNKPVAAINTLKTLAYNLSNANEVIVPMLDARRDEVFTAAYQFKDNEVIEVTEPCVMTIDEIIERYKGQKIVLLGDGAIIHRNELIGHNFGFAPVQLMETRAGALCVAAMDTISENKLSHYNDVVPLYLRKSQAEREYERKMEL